MLHKSKAAPSLMVSEAYMEDKQVVKEFPDYNKCSGLCEELEERQVIKTARAMTEKTGRRVTYLSQRLQVRRSR